MKYSPNNNKTMFVVGQDWNPIMGLLTDNIDFSIMGYTGNLWQRIPQVTVRHKFSDNFEGLLTVMRFERGLSNCCGNTQVRPTPTDGAVGGGPGSTAAFNDPVQMPYFGTRWAYNGTGNMAGTMIALNGAYRYYRSAPTPTGVLQTSGRDINSYLVGLEAVETLVGIGLWTSAGERMVPMESGFELVDRRPGAHVDLLVSVELCPLERLYLPVWIRH
jgi:hypothetical protein